MWFLLTQMPFNMSKKLICIYPVVMAIFGMLESMAQSGPSQINALPLLYNPSFAGSMGCGRLSSDFKLKTLYPNGFTNTSTISYDQFFTKIGTGIGVSLEEFDAHTSDDLYRFFTKGIRCSVAISPKISVKGKYTFAPSLDFSTGNYNYELRLYDTSSYNPFHFKFIGNRTTLRSGIMLNTSKFYIGFTVNLIESYSAKIGINNPNFKNYHLSTIQASYTFQKNIDSKFSFTPTLVFGMNLLKYEWGLRRLGFDFNLNFRYKRFHWGIGRSGIMIGYQSSSFKIMAVPFFGWFKSFDMGGERGGEISIRYLFNKKSNPTAKPPSSSQQ
jgi:hypothetical protein